MKFGDLIVTFFAGNKTRLFSLLLKSKLIGMEERITKTIHISKEDFISKIMDYETHKEEWVYLGDKPCIIDFYASWCGPCAMIAPILDELAEIYDGKINIYKINTEVERELSAAFGIRSIPTLIFCPMNDNPHQYNGALPKDEFERIIKELLLAENSDS